MKIIICQEDNIRINKILALNGICSRRQADKLIQSGKIKINLARKNNDTFVAAQLGDVLTTGDKISISEELKYKYVIEHKTIDIQNIKEKLKQDSRKNNEAPSIKDNCLPIAPLDMEYSGLNIYTNDTSLIKKTADSDKLEYEYTVQVREHCSPNIVNRLTKKQIHVVDKIIDNTFTLDTGYQLCKRVSITGANKNILNIVLTEHKAHIIKRMLNAIHLNIVSVKRVRIGNLNLRSLNTNQQQAITAEQVIELQKLL